LHFIAPLMRRLLSSVRIGRYIRFVLVLFALIFDRRNMDANNQYEIDFISDVSTLDNWKRAAKNDPLYIQHNSF